MGEVMPVVAGDIPLDRIGVILPHDGDARAVLAARPAMPFSPPVLAFVEALGRALRGDPAVRRHPELVALGFWARAANIARLRARFEGAYPEAVRLPRGRCLHIAPSNVDTIFIYSLLLAMLAGNINLVRVSSRAGEQATLLMQVFARCLAEADPAVRVATAIIRYDHDAAITDALSAAVDLRIVWGGDETVRRIRQSPLAPAGTELVFPNKFSLAVIDAEAWDASADHARIARDFVNDAFWFGQMACSSPRVVVWRGSAAACALAGPSFWDAVEAAIDVADPDWEDAHAVAKLMAEQEAAIDDQGVTILPTRTNRLRVVRCNLSDIEHRNPGNGFFRETRVGTLPELVDLARPHWQTVASFGVPEADWRTALAVTLPSGIDRVVPFGSALNFDAIWDGKDLLAQMTRITVV